MHLLHGERKGFTGEGRSGETRRDWFSRMLALGSVSPALAYASSTAGRAQMTIMPQGSFRAASAG
ncbi:MAG: hypothetical protein U5J83_15780 [Bryobacterales bacterium]|nr:hypothetical protein [Bryobacterales bacterium]